MLRITHVVLLVLCVGGAVFASEAGLWLDVPFVKQEKNGCGAASIAMVMQYWQLQQRRSSDLAAVAKIEGDLHWDTARGTYASDMERYFRRNGYATFVFDGEWSDLKQHLAKGRPLIAALKPGAMSPFHYVVVAGIDEERQLVLLNDAAQRKLVKEDRSTFEHEWKGAGNWTLLAVPETGAH